MAHGHWVVCYWAFCWEGDFATSALFRAEWLACDQSCYSRPIPARLITPLPLLPAPSIDCINPAQETNPTLPAPSQLTAVHPPSPNPLTLRQHMLTHSTVSPGLLSMIIWRTASAATKAHAGEHDTTASAPLACMPSYRHHGLHCHGRIARRMAGASMAAPMRIPHARARLSQDAVECRCLLLCVTSRAV